MKNRFDRQFKNAFNETYNYSNENIEANFNKETKTKWYNHRLRYSSCLIILTMLITISLSALVFGLWYGEKKNKDQSQEILEYVIKENEGKFVELFYSYKDKGLNLYLFSITVEDNSKSLALYYINTFNDITKNMNIIISCDTARFAFSQENDKQILYLDSIKYGDTFSLMYLNNEKIKLNISRIFE